MAEHGTGGLIFLVIIYCKKCGAEVLSLADRAPKENSPSRRPSNQTGLLDVDMIPHAAILSMMSKVTRCPNCRRTILRTALVRADVLFGEWTPPDPEEEKRIEFYV